MTKFLASRNTWGVDEFSLVDIFCLPYTQKLFEIGDGELIESRPNVKAWWERVSTRESWKNVLAAVTP
jgi:glutathione S-transferase